MNMMKRSLICVCWILLVLAGAPAAFADDLAPQSYAWPWWPAMQWSGFGWIFPFICFGIMIVMFLFMLRIGVGCMSRGRRAHKSGFRNDMNRFLSDPSASALEILNERYAKGEIGKQEYEEKKASIS
jgi:uncharacterized membrane protein